MRLKVSGGLKEESIVVGNNYDKYNSRNPIVNWLMKGFNIALSDLVTLANPRSIHEIGCGEGYWVLKWNELSIEARGSDFSKQVIELAKENAQQRNISADKFLVKSIYDLTHNEDDADLIVCCEVLEHLERPEAALQVLQKIVSKYLIISVPREPIWCVLNLMRGKYIRSFGNTPGHIQHWSKRGFVKLLSKYFEVEEFRGPIPWTMLLCGPKRTIL